MLAIVNPCNPTGDYLNIFELKDYIQKNTHYGDVVLVDESMLMWLGRNWREESLIY
jgi:histidinol-phosphate/aromatic aminotransferase/cobyric acid decarboxylase-like protein